MKLKFGTEVRQAVWITKKSPIDLIIFEPLLGQNPKVSFFPLISCSININNRSTIIKSWLVRGLANKFSAMWLKEKVGSVNTKRLFHRLTQQTSHTCWENVNIVYIFLVLLEAYLKENKRQNFFFIKW